MGWGYLSRRGNRIYRQGGGDWSRRLNGEGVGREEAREGLQGGGQLTLKKLPLCTYIEEV